MIHEDCPLCTCPQGRQKILLSQHAAICTAYAGGESPKQLATEYNVGANAIRAILHKYGHRKVGSAEKYAYKVLALRLLDVKLPKIASICKMKHGGGVTAATSYALSELVEELGDTKPVTCPRSLAHRRYRLWNRIREFLPQFTVDADHDDEW